MTCRMTTLTLAALLLLLTGGALAQYQDSPLKPLETGREAEGDYDLSWWTVDGGGATFSTGGSYALGGTIGQPDAGMLTGADYALAGGFWRGGAMAYRICLPLILRGY